MRLPPVTAPVSGPEQLNALQLVGSQTPDTSDFRFADQSGIESGIDSPPVSPFRSAVEPLPSAVPVPVDPAQQILPIPQTTVQPAVQSAAASPALAR